MKDKWAIDRLSPRARVWVHGRLGSWISADIRGPWFIGMAHGKPCPHRFKLRFRLDGHVGGLGGCHRGQSGDVAALRCKVAVLIWTC